MEFALIAAGTLQMRAESTSFASHPDTLCHWVSIAMPFHAGKYGLTQARRDAVRDLDPSRFNSCGADRPVENAAW